ncbi:unnamed protein product, partial [Ascophyllum nodosum]
MTQTRVEAASASADNCLGFIPPPCAPITKEEQHVLRTIVAFYEHTALILGGGGYATTKLNTARHRVYRALAYLDQLRAASWFTIGLVSPAKIRVDDFTRRKGNITEVEVGNIVKDLQEAIAEMLKALRDAETEGLWPSTTKVIRASQCSSVSTTTDSSAKAPIAIGVPLVVVRRPSMAVNPR